MEYLGDVVVGEPFQVRAVASEVYGTGVRQRQYEQSLSRTHEHAVVLGVVQRRDVVSAQLAVLARISREGVHLRVVHLQSALGGYPQVTHLVGTQVVDAVVDDGGHAVACYGVERRLSVSYACQSVHVRAYPEAAVGRTLECRHL